MNEAETRAEHVDPALAAAGWGVVAGSRIRRECQITLGRLEGHGRRGHADVADYLTVNEKREAAGYGKRPDGDVLPSPRRAAKARPTR